MDYRARKQNDRTYNIEQSKHRTNWEIIETGVRGCNVNRVLMKLENDDFFKVDDLKKLNLS